MENSSIQPPSVQQSKAPTLNWKTQFQDYGIALAVAIPPYVVLSVYLFYRRGYYDLYIANKILAGVSTILFGLVLLIGVLSRYFSFPDRFVKYRKELGIVAFFLALAHGLVSFFWLPQKFPTALFLGTLNWSFIFGLVALVILLLTFFISNDQAMKTIGRKKWWRLQYLSVRLVFLLIILHVFIMKWSGWIRWYKVGGGPELVHPEWPGAGLLVGWFMVFVVLVRLAEYGGPKFGRLVWKLSILLLPIIYIITFWWGSKLIK